MSVGSQITSGLNGLGETLEKVAGTVGTVADCVTGGIDRKLNYLSAQVDEQVAQSSLLYDNMMPSLTVVGTAGNKTTAVYNSQPFISVRKFYEKEDLGIRFGYPSCKYYNVHDMIADAEHPFYVRLSDTGLEINATELEKNQLQEMLLIGIWVEDDE